jgi:hypothetical protein
VEFSSAAAAAAAAAGHKQHAMIYRSKATNYQATCLFMQSAACGYFQDATASARPRFKCLAAGSDTSSSSLLPLLIMCSTYLQLLCLSKHISRLRTRLPHNAPCSSGSQHLPVDLVITVHEASVSIGSKKQY